MERTDLTAEVPAPIRLAVCICTFRRPQLVGALLDRLREEGQRISRPAQVGIVIVDDDPEKSAEGVVRLKETGFGLGIHYVHSGARNIAVARNKALEGGIAIADVIAMIDDDCLPGPGWLDELLKTYELGETEMVSGVCKDQFPEPPPAWVHRGPYFDPPMDDPDGAYVAEAYVKNLLLSADALRRSDLRFDPEFGRVGGEDALFLIQAQQRGFRNRRARHALVYEQVPADRLTLGYQLRRRFWYGNTEALTTVGAQSATRFRTLLRGGRMVLRSLTLVPMRLIRGQPAELHSAVAVFLQGLGRMLGAFGISVNHR